MIFAIGGTVSGDETKQQSDVAAVVESLKSKAYELEAQGKPAEAIAAMKQAEATASKAKLNKALPSILVFLTTRSIRQDQLDDARSWAVRLYEYDKSHAGKDFWRTRAAAHGVKYIDRLKQLEAKVRKELLQQDEALSTVVLLLDTNQAEVAVRVCRAGVALYKQHLGEAFVEVADAQAKLGRALVAAQRPLEAEPVLRIAVKRYHEFYGAGHPSLPDIQKALSRAVSAKATAAAKQEKLEEAIKLQTEAVTLLRAVVPRFDNSLNDPCYRLLRFKRQTKPLPENARTISIEDDFSTDTTKNYKTSDPLSWSRGGMIVSAGAVTRDFRVGPAAELKLNLVIPRSMTGDQAYARWGFELASGNLVWVGVQRTRIQDGSRSELVAAQVTDDPKGNRASLIRKWPLPEEDGSGLWKVRFDHGLLHIEHGNRSYYAMSFANAESPVAAFFLASQNQKTAITGLKVRGTARAEYSAEEIQLQAAIRAYDQAESQALRNRDFNRAIGLRNVSHRYRVVIYGDQDVRVAASLNAFGFFLQGQQRNQQALQLFQRALEITRTILGEVHPETAKLWNNVGFAYSRLGQPNQAIPIFERLLSVNELTLGATHTDTAIALNNLGQAYGARGELSLALEYLQRAADIRKKRYGEDSMQAASSYSILSGLHAQLGNGATALELAEKCVQITAKTLGENHPQTFTVRLTLAKALESNKKLTAAEQVALGVFQFRLQTYGKDDPRTNQASKLVDQLQGEIIRQTESDGDYQALKAVSQRQVQLQTARYGEQSWTAVEAKIALADHQKLARLDAAQQKSYQQIQLWREKSAQAAEQKKTGIALEFQKKAVALIAKTLGEDSQIFAWESLILSNRFTNHGEFAQAIESSLRGVKAYKKLAGADHPSLVTGYTDLAILYAHTGSPQKALTQLAEGKRIYDQASDVAEDTLKTVAARWCKSANLLAGAVSEDSDWKTALSLWGDVAVVTRNRFGAADWRTIDAQQQLEYGGWLSQQPEAIHRDLDKAKELQRQANAGDPRTSIEGHQKVVQQLTKLLGENRRLTLDAKEELAKALTTSGQHRQATAVLEQLVQQRLKLLGGTHPDVAQAYQLLSGARFAQGDSAGALAAARQALEIHRRNGETETESYATALNATALVYYGMGEHRRAAALLEQVSQLLRKVEGEDGVRYALCRSNLASTYRSLGDPRAKATMLDSIQRVRKAYGEDHYEFAVMQQKAASLFEDSSDFEQAEEMYRKSLATRVRVFGPGSAATLMAKSNLAQFLSERGQRKEALQTQQEIMTAFEANFDAAHTDYPTHSRRLALQLFLDGQTKAALRRLLAAIDSATAQFSAAASLQSESQQLVQAGTYRKDLDLLLLMSESIDDETPDIYQRLLQWKGAVLSRQLFRRQAASDAQMSPVVQELRGVVRKLAALNSAADDGSTRAARESQRTRLQNQKEQLETKLAEWSSTKNVNQTTGLTLQTLQASLPEDGVLVDYYVYQGRPAPGSEDRRQVVAFVCKAEESVKRINLGPAATIASALTSWRRRIVSGGGGVRGDARLQLSSTPDDEPAPQQLVRDKVWAPLESLVEEAGLVLLSPDGFLNQLPFSALPGKKEGVYLLQETPLLYVPAPQMLVRRRRQEASSAPESMLLVGDVDFAAPQQQAAQATVTPMFAGTRGALQQFDPLPATSAEVEAINEIFVSSQPDKPVDLLSGSSATEEALRRLSTGRNYLHFATHGFFQPAERFQVAQSSAGAASFLPGLQSGLVLAGANRGTRFSLSQLAAPDDGLLTAVEVAELDLRQVELAVLSACETGLGQESGGEGLLGLQRAFHLAGAESVVATLWQVDDEATRALMVEFYRNLKQRKLGRLKALRNAQLALLSGKLYQPGRSDSDDAKQLPPRYWAAFILSGEGD